MKTMLKEAPAAIGITNPQIRFSTNQLNESNLAPRFFNKSAAGQSVGGAAFRANNEVEALPEVSTQLLPDVVQTFSNVTIEPYTGFIGSDDEHNLNKRQPDTDFILAHNLRPDENGVLTYEMIGDQLTEDERFMQGIIAMLETPSDAVISSNHFYITRRIMDIAKGEIAPHLRNRVIDIQRFHSLPSLTTHRLYQEMMGVSDDEATEYLYSIGISPERVIAEAQALATGYSIYSTRWERDQTVRSYDGYVLPDGTRLDAKQLKDASMVVPLSYSPAEYNTVDAENKKRAERNKWFTQFDVPLDAEFAAIVGRKDPERGYVTALNQAMSYLAHTDNPMYFGFIGGVPTKSASMMAAYNEAQRSFEQFAQEHPDRAQYIKWIDRIDHRDFAYAADIEIQLPDTESWGLHTLQAMACGKPVIASNIPTYQEWAGNGLIAIDQRDPQLFAEALDAMRNKDAAAAQGAHAARVAARYTHDRSLSAMLAQIATKTELNDLLRKQM